MTLPRRVAFIAFALSSILTVVSFAAAAEADVAKMKLRARVMEIEPAVPVRIHWRYGGEGQGGSVIRGEFTRLKREAPAAPKELALQGPKKKDLLGGDDPLEDLLGEKEADTGQIEIEGKGFNFVYVKPGTWSPAIPVTNFNLRTLLTVTLQPYVKGREETEEESEEELSRSELRNIKMEFELLLGDKVLKRFSEVGPDGPTVGIALPINMVNAGKSPEDQEFLDAVCGLARYAERRAELLESFPWADRPLPQKYAIITDCYGYKHGAGYGVRTTNLDVMANEYRALRQLGVNGLRGAPAEVIQMAARGEGFAKNFQRALINRSMGYPVPGADRDEDTGELQSVPEGAGCPYHPNVWTRAKPMIEETVDRMTGITGFQEIWGLTDDEIGCIFDRAGEGKNHRYVCPHCIRGYRQMLQEEGCTPADFGKQSWEEVDPWTGTGPKPLTWQVAMQQKKDAAYQKALGFKVRVPGDDPEAGAGVEVLDDIAKEEAEEKTAKKKKVASAPQEIEGKNLLNYYNSRFLNYASAHSFTPLMNALDEANAKKQAALDAGETDSAAAKQPWVYSYALRGQTFIRSHSLDFFEFYRHADNGFVYETSHTNRFTQIFDSYICDVGRVVSEKMNKRYGIYVKPHRGSGMQRAMSFASRGGTMLYWYTYGPEYAKGDSFASKPWLLEEMSRCARLLGAAEDRIYGAKPAYPAEIGIVKPRTNTLLGGEINNALWTYVALAHDHVPVDPLDEHMLEHDDLSQYKVIYVSGKYLRKASAERLADWVKAGGTLFTSGGGMLLDEAQEPIKVLWPVFGVQTRTEMEVTEKDAEPPLDWLITKPSRFAAKPHPRSREVLQVEDSAEVLAEFADGRPASIRNKYGQGEAHLVAFPAGAMYGESVTLNTPQTPADMEANADSLLRSFVSTPALQVKDPPVQLNLANVEAVYLQNQETKKRAVSLINWAYKLGESGRLEHNRFQDVTVVIASEGPVQKVRSAWLDKELPFQQEGGRITVTVPELWEADVLLID